LVQKFFASVPMGVWIGSVIILAAAWTKDGWGILVGVVLAVVTMITTSREPEPSGEPTDDAEGDLGP
jgi:hypothetical protein